MNKIHVDREYISSISGDNLPNIEQSVLYKEQGHYCLGMHQLRENNTFEVHHDDRFCDFS